MAEWRFRLREALSPNARVLIDVVPELEWLIGDTAAAPTLGPLETENRFRLTFQAFIRALAKAERPLMVFFGRSAVGRFEQRCGSCGRSLLMTRSHIYCS